ncbi:MAG TPA: thiamine pyrophosphate-binding protein [Vicinamibacterales bacterium]|nr:thiamine pyrophosphate-binding protein [Vicinamibacterales bacterium]
MTDDIVTRLQRAGTGAIFGVPGGGGNLDLIESAGRAGMPFVLTSTETAGAIAALAAAEVTGRPGACLSTLGPGAASLVNGIACAFLDRAPVLAFTDRHPLSGGDRYTHQHIDHRSLFASISKWSATLSGDDCDVIVDTAVRQCLGPPPGPVHLDCDFGGLAKTGTTAAPDPTGAGGSGYGRLLTGASRRPLVIAGLGARSADAAAAIRAMCERRSLPAMVTYKAKGVIADDHPCFAGLFTNGAIEQPLVSQSDLIVGVGLDPVELLPRPWPYEAPAIYVGAWPVPDGQVPFAAQHVTNPAHGVRELSDQLTGSDWNLADLARERERWRSLIDIPTAGLTAQQVVRVAAERLSATHRVTVDAGAHMFPATMLWPVRAVNQLLISNGLSTMGFALPAAIGAAVADPSRPVVALTGDGGLLMCAGELATAARQRLRVMTIVFNDSSLSLIEIKQQAKRYARSGVGVGPVDWTQLAQSFGVAAFNARDEASLASAIEAAAHVSGPSLIEAVVDRSNYLRTLQAVRG